MADVVGMPENLEILSEERFLGYARVKDGKFVDAAELSIPERLPDYIHIWNKVSNFDENSSLAIKEFIMDNNHKNEEDFETKNHIDIDKASDKNHENIQLEEKPKTQNHKLDWDPQNTYQLLESFD